MIADIPLSWASLIALAALICAVIFISNSHLSVVRLCLLLLASMIVGALIPAVRSVLGPSPASDLSGKLILGPDGKPLYTREALHQWSTVTASQDAVLILAGFVAAISILLLGFRALQWYFRERDALP
jgi:hypothetical protein